MRSCQKHPAELHAAWAEKRHDGEGLATLFFQGGYPPLRRHEV